MEDKPKVYISSTFKDLEFVRAEVVARFAAFEIRQQYELSRVMEQMKADGTETPPLDNCIDAVKSSDIYFIVIGYKFGSVPENETRSYTEIEYDTAIEEEGKRKMSIYRIFPSQQYLESKKNDIDNEALFTKFCGKVKRNREVREYNKPEDIYTLIFDCLFENFCRQKFMLKLKYGDVQLNKIDRNKQFDKYKTFRDEFPGPFTIVPIIMLGYQEDMPEKMTSRLIQDINIQQSPDIFRANISKTDITLQENLLLRDVSLSLLGQREENCSFEKLPVFLDKFTRGSRFIVFEINYEQEIEYILKTDNPPELHWVKLLAGFINRLNKSLGDFISTIYIPIHILFNKETVNSIDELLAMQELKKLFSIDPGICTLELGVLNVIEKENLYDWLRNNFKDLAANEIEDSKNDIDKIFKFTNFPIRYNQCTKILDKN